MSLLAHQGNRYSLRRLPLVANDRLRAWDAADEYLLRHLTTDAIAAAPGEVVLVNDAFGALAVALHALEPVVWSDSFLSGEALRHNLHANRLDPAAVVFVPADRTPPGPFGLALIKLPKSLRFFADQLMRLRPALAPGAEVLTGGMIKHTPRRAYELLEEIIGPTTTTLGWKKARLAHSRLADRTVAAAGMPPTEYLLPDAALVLRNLPNVFSRERPDAGTRLLLAHLPHSGAELSAVDLGCGNGILALGLARSCPRTRILGVDESFQAVASARLNAAQLADDAARICFRVDDGLTTAADASIDLVVCNPPFHQDRTLGDLPAWRMFAESARVLRKDGELRIVGNRHLGYHAKLQRLFGVVDVVASDRRFVVLRARQPGQRAQT